jgi:hypothetical protein
MVWYSRVNSVLAWEFGALGVLVLCGLALFAVPEKDVTPALRHGLTAAVLGAGAFVGWKRALPSGTAAGRKDPHSISDGDFRGLLAHSRRTDADPLTEWYFSIHESAPGNAILISAGCEDFTGEEFFPPKWTSGTVLGAL